FAVRRDIRRPGWEWADEPYQVVAGISYKKVPFAINGQAGWVVEPGEGAVAVFESRVSSGDGSNLSVGCDEEDAAIRLVSEIDEAVMCYRNTDWTSDTKRGTGSAGLSTARGDGGDFAARVDFPDCVVARVSDKYISKSVDGNTARGIEPG